MTILLSFFSLSLCLDVRWAWMGVGGRRVVRVLLTTPAVRRRVEVSRLAPQHSRPRPRVSAEGGGEGTAPLGRAKGRE